MPDGRRLKVTTPTRGLVDSAQWDIARLLSIQVPISADLASFPLATFTAPTSIGAARLALTDQPAQDVDGTDVDTSGTGARRAVVGSHEITAKVLPMAGSSLAVRVGSCPQWHGYRTRILYLLQTGGVPITGLRLSGVQD